MSRSNYSFLQVPPIVYCSKRPYICLSLQRFLGCFLRGCLVCLAQSFYPETSQSLPSVASASLVLSTLASMLIDIRTNQERHKSVAYLRLKNSTRTSKCQVFSSTIPEKAQSWIELVRAPGALKGGLFGIFKHPFCCKISKN